ncbi:hypothetical protein GFS24_20680 [Chitinophaga sp. SYP-B3965]|uniref:hypothetical protein n=1 Tax=Chitinophaga sp. SYP-B3965 TaxID=2663120 RepID=UPI001299D15A|nr:hypothetical protein [Chitinophaga sp. SYP-B3965]MRG47550.1 hypothetical protein [Chitinophaga sp. SYP-B3965]
MMIRLLLLFVFIQICSNSDAQIVFRSSNAELEAAFKWAQQTALSYKGHKDDPVGPWYESALPPRSAFCMRDVAHQCIGGEILGLSAENKNMLTLFAKNISKEKDWCSYWEMNKYGVPAPEDYRNDKEFWYNLNANFDIMNACWRMYLWTGNKLYINDAAFRNFHEKSVHEYINTWILQVDSLLTRPAYPNTPIPFNENDAFHRCRGLPSYSEGVPHLKMGIDLIAALYRGLETYASILETSGQPDKAVGYRKKAEQYRRHIESNWWDQQAQQYQTHVTNDGAFGKGEGATFLLWFDALKDSTRARRTIEHLVSNDWNVENQSYFPVVLSRYGYYDQALRYILHLADARTERREYPEVSFGVVEGIIQGLMGVDADARYNRVSTLFNGQPGDTLVAENIPVLSGYITVREHKDGATLQQQGKTAIVWRVKFSGRHPFIKEGNRKIKALQELDKRGNFISFADLKLQPGKAMTVSVE